MESRQEDTLPPPSLRVDAPMRDGVTLDTCIWLPAEPGPHPAILIRTPYSRAVTGVNEPPMQRYLAAGFAVVMQQIRGIGRSGGHFAFMAPHEQSDGYDAVEWVAAQPWCTGAVGLDGHSYAGMTQLTTAIARPPHLRCMVPAVVSTDFFMEPPYVGGVFSRMHTLVWCDALSFSSMLEPSEGGFAMHGFMSDPSLLAEWLSRPARAAGARLTGDLKRHFDDVLDHPTRDDWWHQRRLDADVLAAIDVPTLVVSGNFDPSVGTMALWRGLESGTAARDQRFLLIGPWDHNGAYNGGGRHHGPYDLGDAAALDLVGLRIAFFEHYLKGEGQGAVPRQRVRHFITGANRWVAGDAFPLPASGEQTLFLSSGGHANSSRGDGQLLAAAPTHGPMADHFIDDPDWPIVNPLPALRGPAHMLDLRELARHHDVLVYQSPPLAAPLTLLGEPLVTLDVSADVPDADVVVHLVERTATGQLNLLAFGQLRLRYRRGFDREVLLTPGEVERVSFTLSHTGHQIAAGNALAILILGGNFPLLDPNPHGAGPIADAVVNQVAVQCVHHGAGHASQIRLPILNTLEGPHEA